MSISPVKLVVGIALSGRDEEPSGENGPPPDSDLFGDDEFGENYVDRSNQFATSVDRRFQLNKAAAFLCGPATRAPVAYRMSTNLRCNVKRTIFSCRRLPYL